MSKVSSSPRTCGTAGWVALKALRPELVAALRVERFLREIEFTARLQHPHILPSPTETVPPRGRALDEQLKRAIESVLDSRHP